MFIALLVVLALLLLLWFMLLPGSLPGSSEEMAARLTGRNYAHRGLHTVDKSVPENSMAAFRAALEAGYGCELDIQLTKDGEVVVFHDDTVDRVCGGTGRVDSYTLAELREMKLEGTNERIPTFRELLELVNGQIPLIVELKMGPRNPELCRKAQAILAAYDGPYCVESFDPRIVGWFKKNAPEIVRGQLSAPAEHLNSGPAGVLVGGLLTNFLARPHFIAYKIGHVPLTARFARGLAMKVAWTALPTDDTARVEAQNDAVIFEQYTPTPVYKMAENHPENQ